MEAQLTWLLLCVLSAGADVPMQGFVRQISFALNFEDFLVAFKIDSFSTTNSYTQVSMG